jgi:hypothetical protein
MKTYSQTWLLRSALSGRHGECELLRVYNKTQMAPENERAIG